MRATQIALIVGIGVLTATASFAQSLADIARKEEERRKTQPQPTKVYTNKDLGDVPPATMPPPPPIGATNSDSSAQSGSGSSAKDAKDSKGGKDEKGTDSHGQTYWSGRMKAAQEVLDRDSTFVDALQSRINALTTDFVNRDDPAQRSTIGRDRDKAISELDRLKKKVLEDRKAIADLEEEARRAGVPAGWLR